MPPAGHVDGEAPEPTRLCVTCHSPSGSDHALAAGGLLLEYCSGLYLVRDLCEQLVETRRSEEGTRQMSAAPLVIIRGVTHRR